MDKTNDVLSDSIKPIKGVFITREREMLGGGAL